MSQVYMNCVLARMFAGIWRMPNTSRQAGRPDRACLQYGESAQHEAIRSF